MGAMAAMVAMGGLQLAQGIGQANALNAQGEYQKAMSEINARNAEIMARKRLEKGEEEAKLYGQKLNQTVGTQRVSYAAQGVDIDDGSAAEIQKQTFEIGADDIEQLRNNAFLEAMGYKSQAQDIRRQGDMALVGARTAASQTILGAAIGAGQTMASAKLKAPTKEG